MQHADIVGRLMGEEPMLLVMEPAQVQTRLEELTSCLGLSSNTNTAIRLCASHPWLLTVSISSIKSKLTALGEAAHLSHSAVLQLVQAYPEVLRQSAQRTCEKIAALTDLVPRHELKTMIFREPSLLVRSTTKVLQSFRATQDATGMSTRTLQGLVARRPSVLTRSSEKPARTYKSLSIWRFSKDDKQHLISAHPVLLRLSPREVHLRCRWVRQLMTTNGFYHSTLRRIPLQLLGVLILHLPVAWSRLQYLAESSQEGKMEFMKVIQSKPWDFDASFPDYRRWLHYQTSEMGCAVPWRRERRTNRRQDQRCAPSYRLAASRSVSSPSGSSQDAQSTDSWHSSGNTATTRPQQQHVVSEADVLYYGPHPVRKPRRIVYISTPSPPPPSPPQLPPAHSPTTLALPPGSPTACNSGAIEDSLHQIDDAPRSNHTSPQLQTV